MLVGGEIAQSEEYCTVLSDVSLALKAYAVFSYRLDSFCILSH